MVVPVAARRPSCPRAARSWLPEGLIGDSAAFARAAAPVAAIDSANRAWLRTTIARFGWPTKTLVGEEASSAAWLLVQHADQDTALQALALPLLERAAAAGEAEPSEVALLADRLAVARNQPQEYGTQARTVDGKMVFFPIRDSATVDARRATVGLPPLARYAKMLDSLYGAASTR